MAALAAAGCTAVAVSGALAVDDPEDEDLAAACVRDAGLPACTGHELSGAYGLETRTVSAAVNASILPVVQRTAGVVGAPWPTRASTCRSSCCAATAAR